MKRNLLWPMAALLLSACEQASTPKPDVAHTPRGDAAGYGLKPLRNDWPLGVSDAAADLSDRPLTQNYYLVFDGSGSMGERGCSGGEAKIDVAKSAVSNFLELLPAGADVGLFVFDERGITERTALAPMNKAALRAEVARVVAGGGTPLSSGIEAAFNSLTEKARRQLGYGEYHLVVITDGEASVGYEPKVIVDTITASSPVMLHTIGFCVGEGHSLNRPSLTRYHAADDAEALGKALGTVLAEAPDFGVDAFTGKP